ncbi:hypothetical protein GH5_08245 [Leishmania sp. Ghana 2012 LV757]|uniref:hypothetical protein n=1 Tax=Leishmania sp. Ghana 2012 LV757 TaxID=2803181 RepID=UPI001B3FB46D|nr:hypothetical protein GH5_08245 [Leishmania sp. Ghana 2012 LV757]
MATMAVMDAPLPPTTTAAASTRQGLSVPPPQPAAVFFYPAPHQQPSTSTSTLGYQLLHHQSPRPDQHCEGRRHPRPALTAPSSSSSSMSSALSALHVSHTDAYEAAVAAEAWRTDAGGALLQPPTSPPLCAVKSYGTASDSSDAGSRCSLSAVVAVQPPNDTLDSATAQMAGCNAPGIRDDFQPGQLEQHTCLDTPGGDRLHRTPPLPQQSQYVHHSQQREEEVGPGCVVGVLECDPHVDNPLNGDARSAGEAEASESTPFAGGTAREPPAARAGANGDVAPAEGRRPSSSVDGENANGNDTSSAFPTRGGSLPAGSPPTFVELVVRRLESTSLLQFLWVVLLMAMLLVGNAFQVIFLNFWIRQFPTDLRSISAPMPSSSSSSASSDSGSSEEHVKALASSYTTFVISAVLFPVFFIVLSITYALWRRPNLSFTREWAGWRLLLGIGAMDALNSAMAIYAAANTPEVLQALFVSLVPIYSAIFTKWLLKDPRDYANPYVFVSFVMIASGVALASLFNYVVTHRPHPENGSGGGELSVGGRGGKELRLDTFSDGPSSLSAVALDQQLWCLIFFFSVPPTVLMNVWQTMYMIRYADNDQLTAYLAEHADEAEYEESDDNVAATSSGQRTRLLDGVGDSHDPAHHPSSPAEAGEAVEPVPLRPPAGSASQTSSDGTVHGHYRLHVPHSELHLHGEDATVKLVMLTADTTIQAILAFVLMPMDALPWFGGSSSIQEVVQNLNDGIECVLHCPRNMRYCILYSTGFVLVYIASAYLNRYSVTLCSMVSQLSGPITALVLIAFPSLNMTGDASPWYVSAFAILLLSCGTVMYVYWDEVTVEEKAVGEMQLKWAMMQEQQSLRHAPSSVGNHLYHEIDDSHSSGQVAAPPPQQQRRHPRSRRYRRRRQSDYVVVVDQDASDAAANEHPHHH